VDLRGRKGVSTVSCRALGLSRLGQIRGGVWPAREAKYHWEAHVVPAKSAFLGAIGGKSQGQLRMHILQHDNHSI
jgi:hypothetical protein